MIKRLILFVFLLSLLNAKSLTKLLNKLPVCIGEPTNCHTKTLTDVIVEKKWLSEQKEKEARDFCKKFPLNEEQLTSCVLEIRQSKDQKVAAANNFPQLLKHVTKLTHKFEDRVKCIIKQKVCREKYCYVKKENCGYETKKTYKTVCAKRVVAEDRSRCAKYKKLRQCSLKQVCEKRLVINGKVRLIKSLKCVAFKEMFQFKVVKKCLKYAKKRMCIDKKHCILYKGNVIIKRTPTTCLKYKTVKTNNCVKAKKIKKKICKKFAKIKRILCTKRPVYKSKKVCDKRKICSGCLKYGKKCLKKDKTTVVVRVINVNVENFAYLTRK